MLLIGSLVLPGVSDGKESACNERNLSSIPGLGHSSGGGHGDPLQCSCLGSWWATVHGVAESDTTERWGRVQVAQLPLWIFRGRGSLDKNYCLIAAV